jgi:hypothetical protein
VKFWQVAKIVLVLWPSLAACTYAVGLNDLLSATKGSGWPMPESVSLAVIGFAMLIATRQMRRQAR